MVQLEYYLGIYVSKSINNLENVDHINPFPSIL